MLNRGISKKCRKLLTGIFLYGLAAFICLPFIVVVSGSIMSNYELNQHMLPIVNDMDSFLSWKLVPDYPTLKHFSKLLLFTPEFYVVFWNSIKLEVCILIGQLLVALPGAWAFAMYPFPFRKKLFSLYVVLMLMPFQVTMLSNYLLLDALHMMDTHKAIILPAVFSTFPVFLMYRGFRGIQQEILDAARIDGAGEFRIFVWIGLPLGSTGILSAMVLGFLEYWSLLEQPLSFLKDKTLWPLSLFLPEVLLSQSGYIFAASVVTLIPVVFVFAMGQEYLERGIVASALK